MNIVPMYATQRILMERIGYEEPDKEEKTILALLVEIGECANEWQGFKYWKKDNSPKKYYKNKSAEDGLCLVPDYDNPYTKTLEEYVDGFHFVLQLGIYLNMENVSVKLIPEKKTTITKQFNGLYWVVSKLLTSRVKLYKEGLFLALLQRYLGLGEMLGFTCEQIEQAYYSKNKVNHARQENGY